MLKVEDESTNGLSLFGQEMDNATAALARMNMILHNSPTAQIWKDNTLSDPHWKDKNGSLKKFDFAVANPPFSFKSWSNGVSTTSDVYGRFEYGVPPEKNGDYAFLLHILKSLKSTGKGAVILPHGVLFRGNVEADIRRKLICQGYIKGIIGLPANLFYGTGIPACIIVIDKEKAGERKPIFMIDASKAFMKDGNKNRLRAQDIHKIVDVFNKQLELPRYSRMVEFAEIEKNDFNLNIPRYIDASAPEDIHDLMGHLSGGIPNSDIDALEDYWKVFPSLRKNLFKPNSKSGYSDATVPAPEVKATIMGSNEFKSFLKQGMTLFQEWKAAHNNRLKSIAVGDKPKDLIFELSEDLLTRFAKAKLLNKYDIYQIMMDYWAEAMQDDVYIIAQDGWKAGNVVRQLVPSKDKNDKNVFKEVHDFEFNKQRYKSDLIPPALVVAAYFAKEKTALEALQAKHDQAVQELESYVEEHSGEDGLIEEAKNDKGSVTQASLKARLKATKDADETKVLEQCLKLVANEAKFKKAVKDAKDALDAAVFKRIPTLSMEEIKKLVIEDKWSASLQAKIQGEIERMTQQLANRIKTLEERYSAPLPMLSKQVVELSDKVESHLKKMGLKW